MQLLYRSVETLIIGGYTYIIRVTTNGNTTFVDFNQNPRTPSPDPTFTARVYYGNQTKIVNLGPTVNASVTFSFDPGADRISLNASSISYGGMEYGSAKAFQWHTVAGSPDPETDFAVTAPAPVVRQIAKVDVRAPEGMYPAIIGVWSAYYSSGEWQINERLILEERDGGNAWHDLDAAFGRGSTLRYIYVTAYYDSMDKAALRDSDYTAVAEYQSPIYTLPGMQESCRPYDLTWSGPVRGCPTQIRWGTYLNFAGTFRLQRSVNGGAWELIYAGTSNHFTDPAGEWETVNYRVQTSDAGLTSPWITGSTTAVGRSNIYVGVGGKPTPASAVYVGRNGGISEAVPMFTVG